MTPNALMEHMPFGKKMKHLREALGLTQEDIAKRCGLNASAISHFESGRREPCLRNIVKICKAFGCSPNVLIDITPP